MKNFKPGDAFLYALDTINEKDHAALVMVTEEGMTLIVERNKINICLKTLFNRYLDKRYEETGYEPEKAIKQVERLVAAWLRDWRNENGY